MRWCMAALEAQSVEVWRWKISKRKIFVVSK